MSLQNFLMLMKTIPTMDDPEPKEGSNKEKKEDNEEISFDNFGSWVDDQRTKNKRR